MIKSIEKGMDVLRSIADGKGEPVTLEKLSEKTGINKSTVSHILNTFKKNGYVTRVSHTAGYTLGPELFFLTRYGSYMNDVTKIIHPMLNSLSKSIGDKVIFAVMDNNSKYIIDRSDGEFCFYDREANLINDDVYRTVTGKVLLANMPEYSALEIYEALGIPKQSEWGEVFDKSSFINELQKIRQNKLLVQNLESLTAFAYPVFCNKSLVGAVGVIKLHGGNENIEDVIPITSQKIIKCVKEIERRLNFQDR